MNDIDARAVFVVHGRNLAARDAMFALLRSLDLRPMEWDQAISLTGVAAPFVGQILDAAFAAAPVAVILLTPDEIAHLDPKYANGDEDPDTRPMAQARPNVLFEAGMALGRNPDHSILVEVGRVRPFSDIAGRHTIRLTNDAASRQSFVNRLRTAGSPVNTSGVDWLTTGDFSVTPSSEVLGRQKPPVPHLASGQVPLSEIVDFDLVLRIPDPSRPGKMQILNRGAGTALNVRLAVPDGAALSLHNVTQPIAKIPGQGKSVTVNVADSRWDDRGRANWLDAFDVAITAYTEQGQSVSQNVFVDMNALQQQ